MSAKIPIYLFLVTMLTACASTSKDIYFDQSMDFGSVQTVAVLPFANLTKDQLAGERVRDIFITKLLASGGVYVVPVGEVAKMFGIMGIPNPVSPGKEEVIKLATALKAQAMITGVVREYGELRSGTTAANVVSLSLQMEEGQSGRVVWSASSTKGGISIKDRLLGGGGEAMNGVTQKAVDELINSLFR